MSTKTATMSSLMLTEEEAFGLLDMCLMSSAENDSHKESAMQKLKEVIYGFFAEDAAEPETDTLPEGEEALPMRDVLACIAANDEDGWGAMDAAVRMSMREHTGRFFFREAVSKN